MKIEADTVEDDASLSSLTDTEDLAAPANTYKPEAFNVGLLNFHTGM